MGEIKLGAHFEAIIRKQIDSGRFQDANDVIEAGLTLLDGFDELGSEEFDALKASINAAFDDGSDDIPIEDAFRDVYERHARDKNESRA